MSANDQIACHLLQRAKETVGPAIKNHDGHQYRALKKRTSEKLRSKLCTWSKSRDVTLGATEMNFQGFYMQVVLPTKVHRHTAASRHRAN